MGELWRWKWTHVTGAGGILHELDVLDALQGNAEVGIQGV